MFVRFLLILGFLVAVAAWKLSTFSAPTSATITTDAGTSSSATLRFVLPTLKLVVEKR